MAAVISTEPAAESATSEAVPSRAPVVIDLGKRSRKKVRRLRRGRGPLLNEARSIVAELRGEGRIDSDAQVVFLVVKQKKRRSRQLLRGLL